MDVAGHTQKKKKSVHGWLWLYKLLTVQFTENAHLHVLSILLASLHLSLLASVLSPNFVHWAAG